MINGISNLASEAAQGTQTVEGNHLDNSGFQSNRDEVLGQTDEGLKDLNELGEGFSGTKGIEDILHNDSNGSDNGKGDQEADKVIKRTNYVQEKSIDEEANISCSEVKGMTDTDTVNSVADVIASQKPGTQFPGLQQTILLSGLQQPGLVESGSIQLPIPYLSGSTATSHIFPISMQYPNSDAPCWGEQNADLLGISIALDEQNAGVASPSINVASRHAPIADTDNSDKPPLPISVVNPEWQKLLEQSNQNKATQKSVRKENASSETLRRSSRNKGSSSSI